MRKLKHLLEYAGVRLLASLVGILPWALVSRLVGPLSQGLAGFLPSRQRLVFSNLRLAFPQLSDREIRG